MDSAEITLTPNSIAAWAFIVMIDYIYLKYLPNFGVVLSSVINIVFQIFNSIQNDLYRVYYKVSKPKSMHVNTKYKSAHLHKHTT